MADILLEPRVLCRTLLHQGRVLNMQVVDRSDGNLNIISFTVETAATVFEPSPVAIVRDSAVTEFLLDDLELLSRRSDPIRIINGYLEASGLYPSDDEEAPLSLLRL